MEQLDKKLPELFTASDCSVESGEATPLSSDLSFFPSLLNCTRSAKFSPKTKPELLTRPLGEV